jgi:hypothetical protein
MEERGNYGTMGKAAHLYTKEIHMIEVVESRPLRSWLRMVEPVQLQPPCLGRVLLARGPVGGCEAVVMAVIRSPVRLVP